MDYRLSQHALDVMSARKIKSEWIEKVLKNPSRQDVVRDNEVHYFTTIPEFEGRCLKVVFNPLTGMVVTAYFDRNMRKKGCR